MIAQGCGYLPGFGHHPGTIPLLAILGFGFLYAGLAGVIIIAIPYFPIYLIGAYERAKDYHYINDAS